MTDTELQTELQLFQDELYARYGTPPTSDDEKEEVDQYAVTEEEDWTE